MRTKSGMAEVLSEPTPTPLTSSLKLNIGCGRALRPTDEGWVNCDLYDGPGIDSAFDCQKRWPFEDESVIEIQTDHMLEHLNDPMAFFREAWRVLIPNGSMTIRVPYGWHQSCWWDLTHLRPWLQESFAILQPGFMAYTRNYQHDDLGFAFWVAQAVMVLDRPWVRMFRFRPLRPVVRWAGRHLLNVYRELMVQAIKADKEDGRSTVWGGEWHPCNVPVAYGGLEHEYLGKSAEGLQVHKLLVFTDSLRIANTGG